LLGLWNAYRKENRECNSRRELPLVSFNPEPTQLVLYLFLFLYDILLLNPEKRGKVKALVSYVYRFLSKSNARITPTAMIATIMPAIPGSKY
jgi:hypothetical protein